jgi:hypothetical protein
MPWLEPPVAQVIAKWVMFSTKSQATAQGVRATLGGDELTLVEIVVPDTIGTPMLTIVVSNVRMGQRGGAAQCSAQVVRRGIGIQTTSTIV